MALGATWDPNLAEKVGKIKGFELSALGINMLFGPSLDILENPNPEGLGDMETRTFGGDPFG
jgi:beta-N-acetylhexosaminidase